MTAALHVGAQGEGPPLVLLHGWAMHSGLWGGMPARLARRFRVLAVDLPGHGWSAAIAPEPTAAMARRLADRLAGEGPLRVVGWSLGAAVALQWAQAYPGQVERLLLVAGTPRFVSDAQWPYGMPDTTLVRFGDELRVAYAPTLRRFLTLQLQGCESGRAVLAQMRAQLFSRGDPSPATLAAILDIVRAIDLRDVLGGVRARSLVVAGERDTIVPPAGSQALARRLPHARYEEIPGAAHVPFLSHPDAFAGATEAFLDESEVRG